MRGIENPNLWVYQKVSFVALKSVNPSLQSSRTGASVSVVTLVTVGQPNLLEATLKPRLANCKLLRITNASSIDCCGCTLAASPVAFPKALLIPSCSLSAPAVAIILFSRRITCGYTVNLEKKVISPAVAMVLLAANLAASRELCLICIFSVTSNSNL